jgi:hypothetical protein
MMKKRLVFPTFPATPSSRAPLFVIALVVAFPILSVGVVHADQGPIAAVADGKPWNFTRPGKDRATTLTVNTDGTAIMRVGMRTVYPKWREAAGDFCLTVMPSRPERCVTLKQADHGYDALERGAVTFQLRR